jgi:hypothetical protein
VCGIYTVGKLKANSVVSVIMRIGGATKFLTDRIIIRGIKHMTESSIADFVSSTPKTRRNIY